MHIMSLGLYRIAITNISRSFLNCGEIPVGIAEAICIYAMVYAIALFQMGFSCVLPSQRIPNILRKA